MLIRFVIVYSGSDFNLKNNESLVIKSLSQLLPKILSSQHSMVLIQSTQNSLEQDVSDISELIIQMSIEQNVPVISIDVKCLIKVQCTGDRLYKQQLNIFLVDDFEGFRLFL